MGPRFVTRFAALACLLVAFGRSTATAAEPIAKTDLFTAGDGGYAVYRIPGIVVTAKGTLLAYCEARKTGGDWAGIDVYFRRSTDRGKTWEPARRLVEAP